MPIESRLLAGPVPASLLIIDDEPQVRTVLKDALGECGFSIDVAADGESAGLKGRTTPYSGTIFATLDPDELYGRLVKSAMQILRADDASLMLLGENRELYIARSTSSVVDTLTATRLALGERVAGRVAQQAEPAVINDDVATV